MKRSNQAIDSVDKDQNDNADHKKIKLSSTSDQVNTYSFSDLTRDEWTVIFQYLSTGGVLMLAMTCKDTYEWTMEYIKKVICKYYVKEHPKKYSRNVKIKEWSIVNALRFVFIGKLI